ncbi:hypothetical protein M752DRAFT_98929 [Aspergillus phoenicis ATCC 13157]|uniref:Uncharacterized protein n=1 Tax=Aspergillus phoenicis ATCC 13157 TaxID=1353007 RepID=A0A370PWD0_ASPPH|nr:hypothetical protein M752DRAFT_98929 [Aspergillus phoenicis ATCC 13157]
MVGVGVYPVVRVMPKPRNSWAFLRILAPRRGGGTNPPLLFLLSLLHSILSPPTFERDDNQANNDGKVRIHGGGRGPFTDLLPLHLFHFPLPTPLPPYSYGTLAWLPVTRTRKCEQVSTLASPRMRRDAVIGSMAGVLSRLCVSEIQSPIRTPSESGTAIQPSGTRRSLTLD